MTTQTISIAAIKSGLVPQVGETFTVNGRTYQLKASGTLFPVSGDGFHTLDRDSFRALLVFNTLGDTDRAVEILGEMHGMTQEAIEAGRAAWRLGQ